MEPASPSSKPPRFTWTPSWAGTISFLGIGLVLLLGLAYMEENWRGARFWDATRADLEARGESFDRDKFIPPLVPDDQDFAALSYLGLSYFKTASDGRLNIISTVKTVIEKIPVSKDDAKEKGSLPYLGNWQKGEPVDAATVRKQLEEFLHLHNSSASVAPSDTPFDVFSKICPVVAELRQANPRLPLCRFDLDYANPEPWNMRWGPVVDLISVTKLISYDARLALLSHRPDIALEDSQVVWKLYSGLSGEPTLISGLVAAGVVAIQLGVLEQGLHEHDWNDAQLAQFDSDLSKIDALSEAQFCLRSEVAVFMVPLTNAILKHRSILIGELFPSGTVGGTFDYKNLYSWEGLAMRMFYTSVPNGWLQINRAHKIREVLIGLRAIDPAARRVHPELSGLDTPDSDDRAIGSVLGDAGSILAGIKKFAYMQVQVDMARIACRLERYRLAHGSYPITLDALAPAYGSDMPHDIMSGQSYIYRLEKDGDYLLYSIAWNQKDDNGDISSPAFPANHYPTSESLDWPWPNHPYPKK